MAHLLKSIKQNSEITHLELEVNSTQPAAVALCKRCGFEIIGKTKRVLGDEKEYENLVMELRAD